MKPHGLITRIRGTCAKEDSVGLNCGRSYGSGWAIGSDDRQIVSELDSWNARTNSYDAVTTIRQYAGTAERNADKGLY